jgi:hypothetical protein
MTRREPHMIIALVARSRSQALCLPRTRGTTHSESAPESAAAGPQKVARWRETYGPPGEQPAVHSLEVTHSGWRARIGVKNSSSVARELDPGQLPTERSDLALQDRRQGRADDRNTQGTLPAVRAATLYEPALPKILDPDKSWNGVISARGALVAHSWVRVVFGALVAVGKTPNELSDTVVWITDNTYRLRR